jgi:dTDP-4-amino-4,6-dideoxygalactose transaminase
LQAALLRVKLKHLDADNQRRRDIAVRYTQGIKHPAIVLPAVGDGNEAVWHVYVVRTGRRDALQTHLRACGIDTLIHYPIPPHRQQAYAEWNVQSHPITECIHREVLSLPISPVMTEAQVTAVIDACNAWGAA